MRQLLWRFDTPDAVQGWTAIDDRVMGGVSRSRLRAEAAGHAVFEGEVSLARNGGFASVRSPSGWPGRAGAQTCLIEVRGDPATYKLSLFTEGAFDAVAYQAEFTPTPERWTVITLPISGFQPRFRGRDVPGAPPLDPALVRQVGLMIASRQAGPFALGVRSIALA